MNISIKKQKGWNIVAIAGRLVVREINNVRKVFESLEKAPSPCIAIDFTKTVYIDSSSITLLLNFQKRVKKAEGILVGFGANDDILDIFSIVHLDEYIDIYRSFEDIEKSVLSTTHY